MLGVSCIMLTRIGREPYFLRSIDMFRSQTIKNKELIIIHSENYKFSEWISLHTKNIDCKVIYHPGTLGSKRNIGVMNAKYSWIATFDDDDIHLPNRLEFQLSLVKDKGDVFTAFSRYVHIFERKKTAYLVKRDVIGYADKEWLILEPTLFASKKLVLNAGGFSDKNESEDSDLIKKIFNRYVNYKNIDNKKSVLYGYVNTGGGVMSDSHHIDMISKSNKLSINDIDISSWSLYLTNYTINCCDGRYVINNEKVYSYY